MFNFDTGRMIVGTALLSAIVGGTIGALVMLAWPWLWALAKPMLHVVPA